MAWMSLNLGISRCNIKNEENIRSLTFRSVGALLHGLTEQFAGFIVIWDQQKNLVASSTNLRNVFFFSFFFLSFFFFRSYPLTATFDYHDADAFNNSVGV